MSNNAPKAVFPGRNILIARQLRSGGPEPFDSEVFSAGAVINVQKPINLQRPLIGIWIRLRGRLGVTTALTALAAEWPYNLFRSIKVFGTHVTLGSQILYQQSSEMIAALNAFFNPRSYNQSWGTLTGVAGGLYAYNQGLGNVAIGNYDFDVKFFLPTYPYGVSDFSKMQYLWDARSWGQSLQMQLTCGDILSAGTGGAATFTAFGSASGSPSIDILLEYANLSPAVDAAMGKAVVVRNSNQIGAILTASGGAGTRLVLLQNQKTNFVLVKTGILEAASNNVYASLSDAILEQTIIRVGTKPLKNLQYNEITRTQALSRLGSFPPAITGFVPIPFDDGEPANNPHASFRADTLQPATQMDVASIVTGTANAVGEVVQEMVYGEPSIAAA